MASKIEALLAARNASKKQKPGKAPAYSNKPTTPAMDQKEDVSSVMQMLQGKAKY